MSRARSGLMHSPRPRAKTKKALSAADKIKEMQGTNVGRAPKS